MNINPLEPLIEGDVACEVLRFRRSDTKTDMSLSTVHHRRSSQTEKLAIVCSFMSYYHVSYTYLHWCMRGAACELTEHASLSN
jgi:hypothetical protein